MHILAKFTIFLDFHYFRKAVETAFLGISKIPQEHFEITIFLAICSKNLVYW